jgi:hypothetical protein
VNNIVLIAAVKAEEAARAAGDVPLEDRARAAMRAVQNHWLATKEEDQFLAACEGLARTVTAEERERIEDDLHRLNKVGALLQALQAGVPVDIEAMAADTPPPENPLGLRRLWTEVAA